MLREEERVQDHVDLEQRVAREDEPVALLAEHAAALEFGDERTPYVYSLRVLGFLLILWAIIDKNLSGRGKDAD